MTVFFYILINQEMIKLPKDSTVLLHTKFGFTQQPYSSPNFAPTSCISLDNLYGIFSQSILEFEGNGTPLQYFCLENPMDGGAWWAAIHGVAKSQTQLHFHLSLSCFGEGNGNPLQRSCLENPRDGGAWWLPSMGLHRVRHN